MLAAISVDYVTRLEQGRASNPSAQVVEPWPGPYGCREPSARAPATAHQACTDAYARAQLAMTRNGQTVPLLGSTVTAPSIPGGGLP